MLVTTRRTTLLGAAAAALPIQRRAWAAELTIRIGVLTDPNGPTANIAGEGSIRATELAVADFRALHPEIKVDVISANMQMKPDLSVAIAREWFDQQGVDCIVDVPSSSAALAVAAVAREKDKVALFNSAVTTDLTGAACSANHIQWTFDSYALSVGAARALVTGQQAKTWFFIAADYALGEAMVRDGSAVVRALGGQVLGVVRHPTPGLSDFSSYILQAQASGAQVIACANAGADQVNVIKQIGEFGLTKSGVKTAALLAEIPEIHEIGLADAQGLYLCNAFYWDRNEASRAFSQRMAPALHGGRPSELHAGGYSAIWHYLKAVATMGSAEARRSGAATIARMKALPTEDPLFGSGSIRQDGRKLHPMYLLRTKAPADSHYAYDYMTVEETIPAEQAFRPMEGGGCKLIKT